MAHREFADGKVNTYLVKDLISQMLKAEQAGTQTGEDAIRKSP